MLWPGFVESPGRLNFPWTALHRSETCPAGSSARRCCRAVVRV